MIPSNYPPDYDPRIDSGEEELDEETLLTESVEYDETPDDEDTLQNRD